MPNIECFICAGSGVMFNPDCGEMLCRCTTDEITRLTAELAKAKRTIDSIRAYATDSLSGPDNGLITLQWCLDGYREIVRRAAIDDAKGEE